MLIMAHVFNFLIKKSKASLLFADKNKLPRRKQRGIVEGNPLIISPQGAGNLPVEIKNNVGTAVWSETK